MREAIIERKTPNILALHYDPERWTVRNLILIPRFAFSLSCLERRRPLAPTARRAGWVGCNILLGNVPEDARIHIVAAGRPNSPAQVRRQYERLRPLERGRAEASGWTLDVLNVVRGLKRDEFSLAEVYACEAVLARLHPDNRNVRPKIRQQLQVLRDMGLVKFMGAGKYRVEMPR